MKHIKEAILFCLICLIICSPCSAYGDSLQEALNAQTDVESTQEENVGMLDSFGLLFQTQIEEKLAAIDAESQRIAAEIEQARIFEERTAKAQPIEDATYYVSTAGSGLCAAWVSRCYQAAGFGYSGGDANDMYWKYCTSSNREDIIPGMIIAVPSHTHTSAGRRYGHVGIIVAHDGQYWVRHNIGPIVEYSLDEWISYYGGIYEPKWGFAAQI